MTRAQRGILAGIALGVASGWNFGNVGAIASDLADDYRVALATIGVFTTAMVVTHMAIQIPAGKVSDRFGPVRAGAAALLVICAGDLVALIAADPAVAIVARAMTGLGTGLSFIAGSALVREAGGSPFAQGLFGGIGLGAGGLGLAVVPQLESALGWRTPFVTSLGLAVTALVLLLAARVGSDRARPSLPVRAGAPAGVLRDRRLYPLAVLYSCSYGLSVVIANWVVELLQRHSTLSDGAAAVVGAMTLMLNVIARPLGGWILRAYPRRTRVVLAACLAAGTTGTLALVAAQPAWLAILGSILVGFGAGIPFAYAFTAAAATRPDAPAASIGLVNGVANFVVLVGTPLVGLTFTADGGGRTGFLVVAGLWLVALVVLPTARTLGLTPQSTSRAGAAAT